jgi:hypothetical protein
MHYLWCCLGVASFRECVFIRRLENIADSPTPLPMALQREDAHHKVLSEGREGVRRYRPYAIGPGQSRPGLSHPREARVKLLKRLEEFWVVEIIPHHHDLIFGWLLLDQVLDRSLRSGELVHARLRPTDGID